MDPFTLSPRANRDAALFTECSLQPISLVLPWPCAWLWNTVPPPLHFLTRYNFCPRSVVVKIWIDCDSRFDQSIILRKMKIVKRLWANRYNFNRWRYENEEGIGRKEASQNFFTGLLSTRNSCQHDAVLPPWKRGRKRRWNKAGGRKVENKVQGVY